MRPRMAPYVVLCGPCRPETVPVATENFINWEALRLAWGAPGQTDSQLWQDLEQEAMLFVHRLLLGDSDIWERHRGADGMRSAIVCWFQGGYCYFE